jgi:protein-S-isoprenylcysteine O-methyltransferase Ste14
MARNPDTARIIMFPPALVGGMMILGYLLHLFHPIAPLSPRVARGVAAVLLLLSVALAVAAQRVMRRAGTSVLPTRPTTALVTEGPYRWTRNPIYLAELGVYLAVASWVNGLAPLLLFPVLFLLLDWGVVRREEGYLSAKFGPDITPTGCMSDAGFEPSPRWARFGIYSIRWLRLPAFRRQAEARDASAP